MEDEIKIAKHKLLAWKKRSDQAVHLIKQNNKEMEQELNPEAFAKKKDYQFKKFGGGDA